MSGLLRKNVNPLNAAATEDYGTTPVEEVHQDNAPVQQAIVPQARAAVVPVMPAPAMATPVIDDDGFDDIDTKYGAYDRVKLEVGQFWFNAEKMGTSFTAQLHQFRKVFVYRDRADQKDTNARAVFSYDKIVTNDGIPVEQVLREWAAEGYDSPTVRETGEVVAYLCDGSHAGAVVMLSLPPTGVNKLGGYRDVLRLTKGLRPSQVLTRVSVGDAVKTKAGETYTPWNFEFVGVAEAAQAA